MAEKPAEQASEQALQESEGEIAGVHQPASGESSDGHMHTDGETDGPSGDDSKSHPAETGGPSDDDSKSCPAETDGPSGDDSKSRPAETGGPSDDDSKSRPADTENIEAGDGAAMPPEESSGDTSSDKHDKQEEGSKKQGSKDASPDPQAKAGKRRKQGDGDPIDSALPKDKKAPPMMKTESSVMRTLDKDETDEAEKPEAFPTTIKGFGYAFNEEGQLRHIKTGEPFIFQVREDHRYNQAHYEALGKVMDEHVYGLLESDAHLNKHMVPVDAKEDEPKSFIYMSEDALSNPDKLLILIHGSGVVRAGQWARRLIINECLNAGTQLPFIHRGVDEGYGIMVLNTNNNNVEHNGRRKPVRENSTPGQHGRHIWNNFVKRAAAKHIAIVAHSYGGCVTTDLEAEMGKEFDKRVFAVAFTDSVHSFAFNEPSQRTAKYFRTHARNWISSEEPLDTLIEESRDDAPLYSAGHPKHEHTSWSSFESVFTFFDERYKQVSTKGQPEKKKEAKQSSSSSSSKEKEEL